MERRSARTSATALSLFVAASLTMPTAHAAPSLPSSNVAATSVKVMCIVPGTEERLAKAVEEARARVTLSSKELSHAQESFEEQREASETLMNKAAQARAAVKEALDALQDVERQAVQNAREALEAARRTQTALQEEIASNKDLLAQIDSELVQKRALAAQYEQGSSALQQEIVRITTERDILKETQKDLNAQLDEVRKQQRELDAAKAEAENALQLLRASLSKLEGDVRDLQSRLDREQLVLNFAAEQNNALTQAGGEKGMRERIVENTRKITEAEQMREQKQNAIAAAVDELEQLEADIASATQEVNTSREKITAVQKRLSDSQAELDNEKKRTGELKQLVEDAIALVNERDTQLNQEEQNLHQANGLLRENEEVTRHISQQIDELEAQSQSDDAQADSRQRLEALKQQKAELESAAADLREGVVTATQARDAAQTQLEQSRQARDAANEEVTRNAQAIGRLRDALSEIQAELDRTTAAEQPKITEGEEKVERLNADKQRIQSQKAEAEAAIATTNAQISAHRASIDRDEAVLQHYGNVNVDQNARRALDTAQRNFDTARQALTAKQEERDQAAAEMREQEKKATSASAAAQAANDKNGELQDAQQKAGERLQEVEGTLREKNVELQAAHDAVKRSLSSLEGQREPVAENIENLRKLLADRVLPSVQVAEDKLRQVLERHDRALALTLESIVAQPLADPHLAGLEAVVAPRRALIAQALAAETEKQTRAALRDRLALEHAKAREVLVAAEKALSDSRALPYCDDDHAGNGGSIPAPQEPEMKPVPEVKEAPHAKAEPQGKGQITGEQSSQTKNAQLDAIGRGSSSQSPQNGGLASTGAEGVSGVATLIAMLGAGAVVTARVRKRD